MTSQQGDESIILHLIEQHGPDIILDVNEFFDLVKHSLSLSFEEKKKVIDYVPTLSQFQFDELKKVFLEERTKFREMAELHPEDIKKLLKQQQDSWLQLVQWYHMESEKQTVQNKDEQKIDDIKKSLWL